MPPPTKPTEGPTRPPEPTGDEDRQPAPRKPASLLQVASAVFWSFFGVRKGRHMLQDMESIKPLHVVIVGVVAGAIFVLTLLVIVRVIIRAAGAPG
jgi:hypothetical protein